MSGLSWPKTVILLYLGLGGSNCTVEGTRTAPHYLEFPYLRMAQTCPYTSAKKAQLWTVLGRVPGGMVGSRAEKNIKTIDFLIFRYNSPHKEATIENGMILADFKCMSPLSEGLTGKGLASLGQSGQKWP